MAVSEARRTLDRARTSAVQALLSYADETDPIEGAKLHEAMLRRAHELREAQREFGQLAQSNGRETSYLAAQTLPTGRRQSLLMIMWTNGPLTDNDLWGRLRRYWGAYNDTPDVQLRSVTAARNHLCQVGLVEDSGDRVTPAGARPRALWQLTPLAMRLLSEEGM